MRHMLDSIEYAWWRRYDACDAQVDRVVLVNPATSFENSPWPALGPLLPQVPQVSCCSLAYRPLRFNHGC